MNAPVTPDGLLLIDKPAGWTSHDVVARCRRLARTRKVGHAGTLDPMATGVLVLGVGKATKLLTFLVGCDKDYDATVRLGQSTITDDAEGDVETSTSTAGLTDAQITSAITPFLGEIQQVPSAVSAIKVEGKRAYHRVRDGEDVQLAARPVTVSRFEVTQVRRSEAGGIPVVDVDVAVTVSSGTYVRALARDLGAALGVGGHLTALRRTRVGGFSLSVCRPLAELEALAEQEQPMPTISLLEAATQAFPSRHLEEKEARQVAYGQRISRWSEAPAGPYAALGPDGGLIAMMEERGAHPRSLVVFAPASS